MLETIARSFALSEAERRVFARLVELGIQPASYLAKSCDMPRNTVRGILDGLVRKGLLVVSRRGNAQLYAVERKEALIQSLTLRKESIEQEIAAQIAVIERHGDSLAPKTIAGRPRITFYDGYKGLERVYEDTLSATAGLRSWGSFDANQEALPKYFRTYYKRRAARGIHMRSIHPDSELSKRHKANDAKELRECRLVPMHKFNWTPEIQMYDNKVNIVSWRDKIGIIIESQEIADALKSVFDLSFEAAAAFERQAGKSRRRRKRSRS